MYHQINTKISDCPDRVSIARWSENWYVKPEALGSIPVWGSQITFRNRQRFGFIRTSSSILANNFDFANIIPKYFYFVPAWMTRPFSIPLIEREI